MKVDMKDVQEDFKRYQAEIDQMALRIEELESALHGISHQMGMVVNLSAGGDKMNPYISKALRAADGALGY
tara:strand:+ start:7117 stop:7329 length:213 start_codon:yes stop_codon:yes gene_type:complete